jgi:chromosome partitioning protein
MDEEGREQRLKRALDPLRGDYDFIIIDCPPALSLLTLNALTAADSVLVPMQCEYYALEGLTALLQTIDALKARLNPELEIEGVLRTMFDVRNNLANAVSAELTNHFGDKVFRTIVPRNVRLAEAPSHGQSIVGYDRGSRGSVAYLGLAGELLRRQRERDKGQRGKEKTQEPASMENPA